MSDDVIQVTFDGAIDLEKALAAYFDQVKGDIKDRYQKSGVTVYDASQGTVPVDKGDLKASGHIEDGSVGDLVQVDVTYGDGNGYGDKYGECDGYSWFVELGTIQMHAQPYLAPAFDQETQALMGDLPGLLGV